MYSNGKRLFLEIQLQINRFEEWSFWQIILGKILIRTQNVTIRSSKSGPGKAPVTSGLRPCHDPYTTTKYNESQMNRWQIVRLILEVVGDRTSKFGRSKVHGHVPNSGPAITSRKRVVHDLETSRTGSCHQSHMMVGWQVARLVWRLTERPCDWSCHLWNSYTTGSVIYYDQWRLVARPCIGRATSRHLLVVSY